MEQRFNAALTQEPRGTVHIPGVNAGSSKSSTNDTMNIELKNDGCDRSTTACDGSEVNVTDARLSSDVAGVGLGNKAADQASTNEVRRPQRDDCGFQVDSRRSEAANKTVTYGINFKSSTHDATKSEYHTDDGYHSTAYDESEKNVPDAWASLDVAGADIEEKTADQAHTKEVMQQQGDDCGFQVTIQRSEVVHNTDANRWSLESGTNNTTQIPRRTDEFGCPTTALNQQGAESVKDAVYDAAGFNLNDKAADQASTNEITQLQEGDYDCQVARDCPKDAQNTDANARHIESGSKDAALLKNKTDDVDCFTTAYYLRVDVDVIYARTSSDVAGVNNEAVSQAIPNDVIQRDDFDFQVASRHSEDVHNTTAALTEDIESCFFRCNSCGFDRSPEEEDPLLEQHARYDVSCPVIQDDIKAQFIDIKSRKREMCGENVDHLRLKEWLLCKACSQSHSTVVIGPCQHFCLCKVCSETQLCCPTCSTVIIHRIHAQLEYEIPSAGQ